MRWAPNPFWGDSFQGETRRPDGCSGHLRRKLPLHHKSAILCLRLQRGDVCTTRAAPDGALHTTWQRSVSSPRRRERLVEGFRTQPLTPIKEVTIETGQSGCDRPKPGAGRRRCRPMAALASSHKVIHSFSGCFSPEAAKQPSAETKRWNVHAHVRRLISPTASSVIPPAVNVHNLARQPI